MFEGIGDIALFLDRVAEGDAIGRDREIKHRSISPRLATSKLDPIRSSKARISRAGLALIA